MNDINKAMKNIKQLQNEGKNLLEMARVGYTNDMYEVFVNTDDPGYIPHFHYRKGKPNNYTFHTCIKLKSPEYFHHTGKEDNLNSKQIKELIKFLQSSSEDDENKTNWEVLLIEWNRNNSQEKVDKNQEMPDYNKLK